MHDCRQCTVLLAALKAHFIDHFCDPGLVVSIVCMSVHLDSNLNEMTFDLWFTLTVPKSNSEVKVIGHNSRSVRD